MENKQNMVGSAIEGTFFSSIKVLDLKISDYFISCILFSQNFSLGVLRFSLPPRGSKIFFIGGHMSARRVTKLFDKLF